MASTLSLSPLPAGLAGRSGLWTAPGPSYRVFRGFQHPWAPSLKDDGGYGRFSHLSSQGHFCETMEAASALAIAKAPLRRGGPHGNIPAMDDLKTIGGRLRALRVELGLTQEEAARKAAISAKSVSRHELGKNEPGLLDVAALARAYVVSMDYLTGASPHRSGLPIGKTIADAEALRRIDAAESLGEIEDLLVGPQVAWSADVPDNPIVVHGRKVKEIEARVLKKVRQLKRRQ